MENDELLVSGMFIKPPRDGAPDFVKGHISIKVDEAVAYLKTYKKQDGYVNIDILVSRGGKLYLKRNAWEKQESSMTLNTTPNIEYPEEINPDNIKF